MDRLASTAEDSSEVPSNGSAELVLQVANLRKTYDGKNVLCGVDFALSSGEALGVIGPSGAGKSTLLKLIDLLESFDEGSINYFGTTEISVVNGVASVRATDQLPIDRSEVFRRIRQRIGFVFQNLNLWEDRTVIDNLILAPTVVLQEKPESARHRAEDLCQRFSLPGRGSARVWQLSGGQRQRVAIVRALMMRPKLILLDEITSALDPGLVIDVMDAIRSLRDDGIAFILVTHHLEFASSICHRIMFLENGQVVQIGTPSELRNESADARVRRFWELIRSAS